ncbi:MAG: hypothetical protein ABI663_17710 [Chryseolinea sp.]
MRHLLYLLAIVLMSSCHPREFSTIRDFDSVGKRKLEFDNTYQFFVREIYKESTNENNSLTNKKEKTDSSRKSLIEIEYILYSEVSDNILYITTVPDRYQKYYSMHGMPETQINARDINTLHFGKLNGRDKAEFKTYKKNTTFTWQYDLPRDSFLIKRIIETRNGVYQDERSVENSIYQGATFRKVNNFEFVYKDNKGDTTVLKMKDRVLYVSNKRKKYFVYFNFDNAIPRKSPKKNGQNNNEGEQGNKAEFTTIIFKRSNRIPYDPRSVVK